jgi:hypothetical protein
MQGGTAMERMFSVMAGFFLITQIGLSATYYIAPNKNLDGSVNNLGSDSYNGLSAQSPWKSFDRAINSTTGGNKLAPGDTLILLDGIYLQAFYPIGVHGQSGSPITIRGQNDGRAIIDGEGVRKPMFFEGYRGATYFVMEGIVARNGGGLAVIESQCDHNTFRRVSGYNADTNNNSEVFIIWANYNLIEDCVAAGSGRKMILVFSATGNEGTNTVRRCFLAWQEWKGANFCPGPWPWGDMIDSYNSSNNTFENVIGYGKAISGIEVFAQSGATANNNKVLGSVSIKAGMNWDGSQEVWPCPSPYNSGCTACADFAANDALRRGFYIGNADGSIITNNLFQDIFAWGNGGLGLKVYLQSNGGSTNNNNRLVRATMLRNGLGRPIQGGITNLSMTAAERSLLAGISNSVIDGVSYGGGGGAQIQNRYVDGTLTAQSLWPWSMEDRIKSEFARELGLSSFSVTQTVCEQILKPNGAVSTCGQVSSDTTPPAAPQNLQVQPAP